ncbi:MAG TPA: sulfatase-like hydrolase/transferase [Firmicutes bacterium]|nr:sulfatase-like hydrolase/transferase [Bacillota bacterium]
MNHPQPNVIIFFTDQQRWDSTGIHGNPLDLTPNFDRMARQGTHLYNSFTPQPVCGPARSVLQTGLYPTATGCFTNNRPLPPNVKTLAHYFGAAGYDTAYIGKWHLAPGDPVTEPYRGGYKYWLAANILEFTSRAYHTVMFDNDNRPVTLPGYRVDAVVDAAIRYIASRDGSRPFYLMISHVEPHHQNEIDDFTPPRGYRERYTGRWTPPDLAAFGGSVHQYLAGYWGQVKRLDEALGRLLDALVSLQLLENTIVLFTSDHGCHFRTRNREYKRSCHESSIRVPAAIQGPGFNGGGCVEELVSLIDIPPTLLDAAGIPIPPEMQGSSILPLLHGSGTYSGGTGFGGGRSRKEGRRSWPQEVFVQISESQVGRAIRTKRWKYGVTAPQKQPGRDAGSDTYVEEYLYDLEADPYEITNLVGLDSHRELADMLAERLVRRMIEAGEAAPKIIPAERRKSGQRKVLPAEMI